MIVQDTRGVVGKGCRACADVRADWKCRNRMRWIVDITDIEGFDIIRDELAESKSVEQGRNRRITRCDMHTFGLDGEMTKCCVVTRA